ncbi:peptidase, partial [Sphaerisporangium cinnabarinum]
MPTSRPTATPARPTAVGTTHRRPRSGAWSPSSSAAGRASGPTGTTPERPARAAPAGAAAAVA